MTEDTRRFRIQMDGADVMGGELPIGNAYISAYGKLVNGGKPVEELAIDECTYKEYALSGQKATTYTIVRVK